MEVAGSPKACGYFSFDPQQSMFSSIGVQVFHWKSRVFITRFLPPKIPSMSDVMFGCPESPEPMELNMDGWGSNEKYPHALGEPATSINRWYLKMKSCLMPYAYSIAREAVDGKPMIRAMFLEDPNPYTFGKATQYRKFPKWRSEVVDHAAAGAIIPMTNPNNNVGEIDKNLRIYELYPSGYSEFVEYDDDGITQAYLNGKGTTTRIEIKNNDPSKVSITIHPTTGEFVQVRGNIVEIDKIGRASCRERV